MLTPKNPCVVFARLEEQVFLEEEILLVKETKVTCLLDISRGIIQILHPSRLYK